MRVVFGELRKRVEVGLGRPPQIEQAHAHEGHDVFVARLDGEQLLDVVVARVAVDQRRCQRPGYPRKGFDCRFVFG